MTGIGRGTALNFQDLAVQLSAVQSVGLTVHALAEHTKRSEHIIMGLRSWAYALGLVREENLTPISSTLLKLDPTLAQPISRGICYVEMLATPRTEVLYHLCRVLLPRWSSYGWEFSIQDIASNLISDDIGSRSRAKDQPYRDTCSSLSALSSPFGFGPIRVLHRVSRGRYKTGHCCWGALLIGYAIRRWWPRDTPYLRRHEVHRLIDPLLIPRDIFHGNLSELERRGYMLRITSSGLDQVRPIWEVSTDTILAQLPAEACWMATTR